ncbi:MAG TPA: hypothetical protein VFD83_05835, partial [Candidatus Polarisedimenticolia bacterium]|nr:hypothetical protein [Candidatus Polarisedimenticolia bacterium]
PNRFYYAPAEIAVVTKPDGAPDFHFLETRYTGSAVARDRGMILHKSLLSFTVRLPHPPAAEVSRAARELGGDLRPYPVKRIATALVYAVIGGDTTSIPAGRFEAGDAEGGTFTERVYTVGLDSLTAQAFRAALEKDQVSMSLGYAFLGDARASDAGAGELTGSPEIVEGLKQALAESHPATADTVRTHVIRAGAIEIGLDVKRFPDLVRRVDLNDQAPPGYAALDVYCYDFNNELRPDLAEKRVEIEAESVSGKRVKLETGFLRDQTDLYSASVRFPVAVRLDRPFRYRTREVKLDGMEKHSVWRERQSWTEILDVTTPAREVVPVPDATTAQPTGVRSILGPSHEVNR